MRWIALASTIIGGVVLAGIVLVTTVAIFYRYVLGAPIIVTEELSRVLLITMAYCGSIALPRLREHMAIEFAYDMCPPPVRKLFDVIHYLVGTAFLGLLAYSGYELATSMGGIKLPALQVPVSWLFGTVAVACGLHAIVYAKEAFDSLTGRVHDDKPLIHPEDKVAL